MSTEHVMDADRLYADIAAASEQDRAEPEDRGELFARLRTEDYEPANAPPRGEPEVGVAAVPAPVVVYGSAVPQISVRLQFPFTIDGLAVEAFNFGPPTVADVDGVVSGLISETEMHARMAGLPVAAMQALRWDDAERVISIARVLAPEIRRS